MDLSSHLKRKPHVSHTALSSPLLAQCTILSPLTRHGLITSEYFLSTTAFLKYTV